jgi:hypothetical protein
MYVYVHYDDWHTHLVDTVVLYVKGEIVLNILLIYLIIFMIYQNRKAIRQKQTSPDFPKNDLVKILLKINMYNEFSSIYYVKQ